MLLLHSAKTYSRFWLAIGILFAGGAIPLHAITYQTIAITDSAAPGTLAGGVFLTFNPPLINTDGHVAFLANLRTGAGGVTSTSDLGIWSTASGVLGLVAREGDETPDVDELGTPIYNSLSSLAFNDDDNAAFLATLRSGIAGVTTSNDAAVYAQQDGDPVRIAREGENALGLDDAVLFGTTFSSLVFGNERSETAFKATLGGATGGISAGLWSETLGALDLVGAQTDVAPVNSGGPPTFTDALFYSFDPPVMDGFGFLAFTATLSSVSNGITSSNDRGIWSFDGNIHLVAQEGDLTGTDLPNFHNSIFADFLKVRTNLSGQIAFVGDMKQNTATGVNSGNDRALWIELESGDYQIVARESAQSPGTLTDAVFDDFIDFAFIESATSGRVALLASLKHTGGGVTSSNDLGIWMQDAASNLQLVVRRGGTPPGTATGVRFGTFSALAVNSSGHLAFAATLTGTGVVAGTNDFGIWAQDSTGTLYLVAREGSLFQVGPGDFRTITSLAFTGGSGGGDGISDGWADGEKLAFSATFTGGTGGIFLASLSSGYAAWVETRYPTAAGGPLGDDDHDGIPNGVEYAFALNPVVRNVASALPRPSIVGTNLTVTFAEPPSVSGVYYGAQYSTDMIAWNSIPDGGIAGTHIFSVSTVSKPRLFFRYQITVTP